MRLRSSTPLRTVSNNRTQDRGRLAQVRRKPALHTHLCGRRWQGVCTEHCVQLRVTLLADVCQETKPSRSNDIWLAKQCIWHSLCACCLRDRQFPQKPVQLERCNSQSKHSSCSISILQSVSARLWQQTAVFAVGKSQGCVIGACLSAFATGASTLARCQGLNQLCCIPERTCHAYADLRERTTC